ncbi:MAG: hypothetical protein L0Y71_24320, partial [Gemmataceae bacterium]|nr:hypothetical protein [Gemmataceae bacterium]
MIRAFLVVLAIGGSARGGDDTETRRLAELEKRLTHADPKVRLAAAGDLLNGRYRKAPPEQLAALLIRQLQTPAGPERASMTAQGFVMEHLARRYAPQAKAAIPPLLRMVTDDRVDVYLRGQAIEASAAIAPGDARVVEAFIVALENPKPTSTSGVHDRAIERLGDMGKAAWPAKKAIARMLDHPWYQDRAFDALGKLARDDEPQPAATYLDRLKHIDKLGHEQASSAFLHLAELGKKDRETAAAARPVLWAVVAAR